VGGAVRIYPHCFPEIAVETSKIRGPISFSLLIWPYLKVKYVLES